MAEPHFTEEERKRGEGRDSLGGVLLKTPQGVEERKKERKKEGKMGKGGFRTTTTTETTPDVEVKTSGIEALKLCGFLYPGGLTCVGDNKVEVLQKTMGEKVKKENNSIEYVEAGDCSGNEEEMWFFVKGWEWKTYGNKWRKSPAYCDRRSTRSLKKLRRNNKNNHSKSK